MEALSPFGGMEVDLMERRGHRFFIGVRGWGSSMLRCDKRKISRLYISRGWHLCIMVAAKCTVNAPHNLSQINVKHVACDRVNCHVQKCTI